MVSSQRGIGITLPQNVRVERGEHLLVSLLCDREEGVFPAVVMFARDGVLGLNFLELDLRQQRELTRMTFSRADTWASTWGQGSLDTPLGALLEVSSIGLRGLRLLSRATFAELRSCLRKSSFQLRSAPRNS